MLNTVCFHFERDCFSLVHKLRHVQPEVDCSRRARGSMFCATSELVGEALPVELLWPVRGDHPLFSRFLGAFSELITRDFCQIYPLPVLILLPPVLLLVQYMFCEWLPRAL